MADCTVGCPTEQGATGARDASLPLLTGGRLTGGGKAFSAVLGIVLPTLRKKKIEEDISTGR